jgi:hypothetical protein
VLALDRQVQEASSIRQQAGQIVDYVGGHGRGWHKAKATKYLRRKDAKPMLWLVPAAVESYTGTGSGWEEARGDVGGSDGGIAGCVSIDFGHLRLINCLDGSSRRLFARLRAEQASFKAEESRQLAMSKSPDANVSAPPPPITVATAVATAVATPVAAAADPPTKAADQAGVSSWSSRLVFGRAGGS